MRKKMIPSTCLAVVAGMSLMFAGCETNETDAHHDDHPKAEHPEGEHPKAEHPKNGEHPKAEHPAGDHPTRN